VPYDSSLDKQVFAKSWEKAGSKVTVGVYSYNNGPKKLQISRENMDDEGNARFAKLGRLSQEELQNILPFIQEALTFMM
jgi:hypothetical protein